MNFVKYILLTLCTTIGILLCSLFADFGSYAADSYNYSFYQKCYNTDGVTYEEDSFSISSSAPVFLIYRPGDVLGSPYTNYSILTYEDNDFYRLYVDDNYINTKNMSSHTVKNISTIVIWSYTQYLDDVVDFTTNIPVFNSVDDALNYINNGDYSGMLNSDQVITLSIDSSISSPEVFYSSSSLAADRGKLLIKPFDSSLTLKASISPIYVSELTHERVQWFESPKISASSFRKVGSSFSIDDVLLDENNFFRYSQLVHYLDQNKFFYGSYTSDNIPFSNTLTSDSVRRFLQEAFIDHHSVNDSSLIGLDILFYFVKDGTKTGSTTHVIINPLSDDAFVSRNNVPSSTTPSVDVIESDDNMTIVEPVAPSVDDFGNTVYKPTSQQPIGEINIDDSIKGYRQTFNSIRSMFGEFPQLLAAIFPYVPWYVIGLLGVFLATVVLTALFRLLNSIF